MSYLLDAVSFTFAALTYETQPSPDPQRSGDCPDAPDCEDRAAGRLVPSVSTLLSGPVSK
jgi:hypothetical protein